MSKKRNKSVFDKSGKKQKRNPKKKRAYRETVFDDVFVSLCRKMPGLLIPLINEAFGTSFSNEEEVVLLQNNYYERYGKIIADSLLKISDRTFHIEMQSTDCGRMVIRMFEYDYTFAVNNAVIKDGSYEINMPESCVVYIDDGSRSLRDRKMVIKLPDGRSFEYETKYIEVQKYDSAKLFDKNLLIFLPYYIVRYRKELADERTDTDRLDEIVTEYESLVSRLLKIADQNENDSYINLVSLMDKVAGYLAQSEESRERMGTSMKARVLELWTEREKRLGKEEEREEINELNRCLLRDKRLDDLERSTTDIEFQNSLLAEYGIGSYKAECAEG